MWVVWIDQQKSFIRKGSSSMVCIDARMNIFNNLSQNYGTACCHLMMPDIHQASVFGKFQLYNWLGNGDVILKYARVWKNNLKRKGINVNAQKTEVMLSSREGHEEINIISEDGGRLKQAEEFKYLGSVIAEEGGTEKAVRKRVKEAWHKWREVSGVILDKKIPLKLTMKVYKSIIRPVLLYGCEIWALRKKEKDILDRTEMRMVRWIAGISLLERRESDDIRRMCGVCKIGEKAREARLRYFGHMKRREDDEPVKKAMLMPVTGRRRVGRQRVRWRDVLKRDMNELGCREEDAMDRSRWKRITRAADPAIQWEQGSYEEEDWNMHTMKWVW